MDSKKELQKQVFNATREYGVSSVLFRNAISKKMGLNVADWECLSLLTLRGISSPTELARYTGLTSGSVTAMLDRLESVGFIKRKPNPNDRRGVLIEVTQHSNPAVGQLVGGVQKGLREIIESYSEKDLKTIVGFLDAFTANVRKHTDIIDEEAK